MTTKFMMLQFHILIFLILKIERLGNMNKNYLEENKSSQNTVSRSAILEKQMGNSVSNHHISCSNLKDKLVRIRKPHKIIQLKKKIYNEEFSQGQQTNQVVKDYNESKSCSHDKSITEEKHIEGTSSTSSIGKNYQDGMLALKFVGNQSKKRWSDNHLQYSDSTT